MGINLQICTQIDNIIRTRVLRALFTRHPGPFFTRNTCRFPLPAGEEKEALVCLRSYFSRQVYLHVMYNNTTGLLRTYINPSQSIEACIKARALLQQSIFYILQKASIFKIKRSPDRSVTSETNGSDLPFKRGTYSKYEEVEPLRV